MFLTRQTCICICHGCANLLKWYDSAGINPARDLGPRLVTVFSGWGMAAMKDFPVYIAGPLIGGPIGAILADFVLFA
jgi:glycerol uptake facilitator-like aquaporin